MPLQDTEYIKPLYQAWETQWLYLIHKNKHRKAAKMRRQRNTAQMKEQNKTPEKELNKLEKSKLSEAEFKRQFIRILKEISEDLNRTKKTQSEMKSTLMK